MAINRVTLRVDPDTTVRKTYRVGDTSKLVYITVNKGTDVVIEPFPVAPPPPTPPPPLTVPSDVKPVVTVTGTSVALAWPANAAAEGVDFYAAYLKRDGVDLGSGGRPNIVGTSVSIPNLAPGAYEVAVAAHNAAGMGPATVMTWAPFTIAGTVSPPPPTPVGTPTVTRSEVIASDGRSSSLDRGNGWGGHQNYVTLHADGTQRVLYIGGELADANRWWKLMKRAPAGGWSLEAQGDTGNEAMLFRDPTTDLAHVVSWPSTASTPSAVPHISSAPSFQAKPIPGAWPTHPSPYLGLGVGADGTVVVLTYQDQLLGGTYTKDTERMWVSGKWNGSAFAWSPVQKKYIGLRRVYNYVMPGGFGNPAEWVGFSEWAGKKEHTAPNVDGSYVWDGLYEERALIADAASHRFATVIPPRNTPSTTGTAVWMATQDAFCDSKGRMFTLVTVSDPRGPSGMYLTVRNSAGQIHQGLVPGGNNPRIVEDGKGRLWLIEFGNPSRIFPMDNATFALGPPTTLSFPQTYAGFGRIAAPRGGNARGNVIAGAFPSGTNIVAYQIRLPD